MKEFGTREDRVAGRQAIAGRRVWITGAGKGIGRAVALEAARRGAVVFASARTVADLEALAAEATGIHPVPLDVTESEGVAAAVERITRDHGGIDVAILNAGTHTPITAATFAVEPVRTLVEVNLLGTVHGLAAVMPAMIARRSGHLVLMGSMSGWRGLPTASAYGATKAALMAMAESLAPDLRRHGVGISIVSPGFVRTPLTARNRFPMPFLMEPEDAARRILSGIERRQFSIAFPMRMAFLMELARFMPASLYFGITSRMLSHQDPDNR